MSKTKRHVYFGDIFAIIVSLVMSIYSILLTKILLLGLFYAFIGLFRLVILILEIIIVRKNDEETKKFTKERHISRLSGIFLLFSSQMMYVFILGQIGILEKTIYATQAIFIAIPFGVYTIYKFISAFISLKKARRSFSPYRETICGINFIVAFISLIPLTYFILTLVNLVGINELAYNLTLFLLCLLVFASTVVISIKMIASRKTPNLIN